MAEQNDWKSPQARQAMVANLERLIRTKGGSGAEGFILKLPEFEAKVFGESTTFESYRTRLSKLAGHMLNRFPQGAGNSQPQQRHPNPLIMQQQGNQPMMSQGVPNQPMMSQGIVSHPTMTNQPMMSQPMQSQPMMSQGMSTQPMMSQGMTNQPMMGQGISNQPMVSQGMSSNQPMMNQGMSTQPMMSQGMQGQPMMSQGMQGQPMMSSHNMGGMVGASVPSVAGAQRMRTPGGAFMDDPSAGGSPGVGQVPQLNYGGNYRPQYSPGPGMPTPSPAMVRQPQPSPSMNISMGTPNPAIMTSQEQPDPSPASMLAQGTPSAPTDEEQTYMDKVRELSVYIEPLKKMIGEMTKENRTHQSEYNKLVALLNILQPTSNSVKTSYDTLCRCEEVLKKLLLPKFKTPKEGIHWCQPFLTAVAESMKSHMGKNALRQTFGPAVQVLYGPELSSSVVSQASRKRKHASLTSQKPDIPHVIQGELARLDRRFRVTRDNVSAAAGSDDSLDCDENTAGLRLQCTLIDEKLPLVPPLKFTLPADYPVTNPLCDKLMELYDTSDFLTDIKKRTLNNLKKLQNKFSMTAMLETWSVSVKQACSQLAEPKIDTRKPIPAS